MKRILPRPESPIPALSLGLAIVYIGVSRISFRSLFLSAVLLVSLVFALNIGNN